MLVCGGLITVDVMVTDSPAGMLPEGSTQAGEKSANVERNGGEFSQ